jgi:cyclopropane-fatty-acyl-phospholipid synthase
MLNLALRAAENGWVPDSIIRHGIRKLLHQREASFDVNESKSFVRSLRSSPVALLTKVANEQHYEVPSQFFALTLGEFRKYSSGYWANAKTLDEAESEMLALTVERAEIKDNMKVLELGCGWGSFLLYSAVRFPNSHFTGVSNSNSQREFILNQCISQGIKNVSVLTADMNEFQAPSTYDRIVSIEMFEHMRNYEILFNRISSWLKKDGKFFLHIFTHREFAYPFEVDGDDNWMGRYFFSGGMMPSHSLPTDFQKDLKIENIWKVSGNHYARTCEAWLSKHYLNSKSIKSLFKNTYQSESEKWFNRWRIFFLSCAELFAYKDGEDWFVSHYLFNKRETNA